MNDLNWKNVADALPEEKQTLSEIRLAEKELKAQVLAKIKAFEQAFGVGVVRVDLYRTSPNNETMEISITLAL